MIKTIWTCWFQGREVAPPLVRACIASWEEKNPGWRMRCLDAANIQHYVHLRDHVDLATQAVTAASLSDLARILLLHEFGGVWVDATLFCNQSLDEWLPHVIGEHFFAFANPGGTRPLASWFLAAEPFAPLVTSWCRDALAYWEDRSAADEYFWFHHSFRDMCARDPAAAEAWARVPKVSADGPHALQVDDRMYRPLEEVRSAIDWTTPVFKLTYRFDKERVEPTSFLDRLLSPEQTAHSVRDGADPQPSVTPPVTRFASLAVSTENLGDHIQILAGQRLLAANGIEPGIFIDRDDEIASAPALEDEGEAVGILLNGWFKTNAREWPPHPCLLPVFHGFHIRLFQCPELVSPESLAYFRRYGPIGCRDPHTEALLRGHGVEAFMTNCLTLTLPRRIAEATDQVYVVSRDERIRAFLPSSIGPYEFVTHYSGSCDFRANMHAASILLERYRTGPRLIITTLLHCALPAIAMGIPVVVIYPPHDGFAHMSDRERFSALEGIVPLHSVEALDAVDWNPTPVDVSRLKLALRETLYDALERRWSPRSPEPLGPIAPSSALPPP